LNLGTLARWIAAALTFTAAEEGAARPGETEGTFPDPAWRRKDRMLSGVTLVLVAIVMLYFANLYF